MKGLFFGFWGVLSWSLMCGIFAFLAAYTWLIVREVGGIRGVALATLFTSAAITCGGFGLLLAHNPLVSGYVIGAVITAAWWPALLAAIVLADLYAADKNSHRSFTTRSYLWYQRMIKGSKANEV